MQPDPAIARPSRPSADLDGPLRECGFIRDGRMYRRDGATFAVSGQWLVLSEPIQECAPPLFGPGLWKTLSNGTPPRRVFEIPSWTALGGQPGEGGQAELGPVPLATLLGWALAVRGGAVPAGWQPPAADVVRSWLPPGALTMRARGYVRQTEVILEPARWALRLPILPRLAEDLSEPRRRALEELSVEAQHRWGMVRTRMPGSPCGALEAEVDLTGAPHSEPLFLAGVDVLRHLFAWLAETAEALGDPSLAIVCLAPGGASPTTLTERIL
ncbi:MAG TPA: hypothetical protein P5555_19325 [Candidatus Paceibacterota bacterium]|nr:hypothetical protein [Verrucomicrobiota bacterium]HRZ47337.1 hypothetical protein [Candidatus Paceibacterota bacterium]HRZ93373.1 hypothetical protein [Candidatus Paceibacterota bacterium]